MSAVWLPHNFQCSTCVASVVNGYIELSSLPTGLRYAITTRYTRFTTPLAHFSNRSAEAKQTKKLEECTECQPRAPMRSSRLSGE